MPHLHKFASEGFEKRFFINSPKLFPTSCSGGFALWFFSLTAQYKLLRENIKKWNEDFSMTKLPSISQLSCSSLPLIKQTAIICPLSLKQIPMVTAVRKTSSTNTISFKADGKHTLSGTGNSASTRIGCSYILHKFLASGTNLLLRVAENIVVFRGVYYEKSPVHLGVK